MDFYDIFTVHGQRRIERRVKVLRGLQVDSSAYIGCKGGSGDGKCLTRGEVNCHFPPAANWIVARRVTTEAGL